MQVIKNISQIRNFVAQKKAEEKKIAFVPTMGALHEGHLSLFRKAREVADITIASIFVNKAQFNDASDYAKYPRQLESDLELLKKLGVDCVFAPDDAEIFPSDFAFKIFPTALTNCLCGATRPGHFDGVSLIITKLFNIVKPHLAIFGEKDFQQVLIIKKLVRDLNFDVEILTHDIVREASGLAMSSRNQRLSEAGKIKAAEIYQALLAVKKDPNSLAQQAQKLLQNGFEKIDYFEIRLEKNLDLVSDFSQKTPSRIFIAVYLEGLRLIDNMPL